MTKTTTVAPLPRHGAYTAPSYNALHRAEQLTDEELAQRIQDAYEGIACDGGRCPLYDDGHEHCYPAEYWLHYYPRTVLVVMVAEFDPEPMCDHAGCWEPAVPGSLRLPDGEDYWFCAPHRRSTARFFVEDQDVTP